MTTLSRRARQRRDKRDPWPDREDQLLALVTPQQMTRAYDEMRKRIARGEKLDVRGAA